ncbi:hypothetical protein NDU88_000941 [Pleurodeles waltl]|uniref:Uncharacterized protein n=1 Tax=Pleurodeles waltl TaxID=8319 RepID=A0AAV7VVH9_PLEWA|nr:hypothetical protein NDU88_000941 [Pleurodeles waltl]
MLPPNQSSTPHGSVQDTTMECILQEVTAVGRRLEGLDSNISALMAETKSIHLDIAEFQNHVTDLEQRVLTMEGHLNIVKNRDQELLCLSSKMCDLEDRSCRDNACFFGFPEQMEWTDVIAFLCNILPVLPGLTFDPLLEFQLACRVGPKRHGGAKRPRLIIACFLQHEQVPQLLRVARSHGPYWHKGQEICITANFSKETNELYEVFLSLWPWLSQLDKKYGLFEPAHMWITKDSKSREFFGP